MQRLPLLGRKRFRQPAPDGQPKHAGESGQEDEDRAPAETYLDREEARRDVFNYIEMFYNPKRRHGYANDVSPVEFENQYFNRLQSV